jgi:hypothetical protein
VYQTDIKDQIVVVTRRLTDQTIVSQVIAVPKQIIILSSDGLDGIAKRLVNEEKERVCKLFVEFETAEWSYSIHNLDIFVG